MEWRYTQFDDLFKPLPGPNLFSWKSRKTKTLFNVLASGRIADDAMLKWLSMVLTTSTTDVYNSKLAFIPQFEFLFEVVRDRFHAATTPQMIRILLGHSALGKALYPADENETDDDAFERTCRDWLELGESGVTIFQDRIDRSMRKTTRYDVFRNLRAALRKCLARREIDPGLPAEQAAAVRRSWERCDHRRKSQEQKMQTGESKSCYDDYRLADLDYLADHNGSFADALARVDHFFYCLHKDALYERPPEWVRKHALPVVKGVQPLRL